MSIIIPRGGKRLSNSTEYQRPPKTITESIQNKKDIEEQLQNYEEISDEDLNFINLNTQLKYISYDKKNRKELFRFGGLLVKVNKEYVVLAGKEGLRFSVQRYTRNDKGEIIHITRFFKRMNESEIIKSQYKDTEEIMIQQNDYIMQQKKEISELKKQLKDVMKKK